MAVNYANLASLAERLIRENGRLVTFRKLSRTPEDSNKPWRAQDPDSDSEVTVRAVVIPYTQFEINNEQIRNGDKRAYVSAEAWEAAAAAADIAATGTLTLTGQPLDTETVVIGGKTYTFEAVLTDVNGHVQIGATAEDSLDNLVAAINLGTGAGTLYAASTTLHAAVSAADGSGTTVIVTAKTVGSGGNVIATTESLTDGQWGGATLTGGLTMARALEFYDEMEEPGGQKLRVLSVGLSDPANTAILYDIHCRT